LLTPGILANLQSQAASGTTLWKGFQAELNSNLNVVLNEGSYEASELAYIADYALGYQVLQNSNPTVADRYADKAIALMKSGMDDYQKGSWEARQFLARGDGTTTTFTLPNTNIVSSTVAVYLAPVSSIPIVHGNTGVDEVGDFLRYLKVSDTSDGPPNYKEGVDWAHSSDSPNGDIEWLPGGKQPADGATYFVTAADESNATDTSDFTLTGRTLKLNVAPTTSDAVYVEYIYGVHAANGSSLAFQQTSAGDGGFNSIEIDDSYSDRYLGKFESIGLDWLDGYVGLTPALRTQTMNMLERWFAYVPDNAYRFDSPESNYGATVYCAQVFSALAMEGRDPINAPAMLANVLDYRQTFVLPDLQQPTNSLFGGFWSEGWNYGAQGAEDILVAGIALQTAGDITAADFQNAEGAFASQAIVNLIEGQPGPGLEYDGGDWYTYPTPFPDMDLVDVLSASASDPAARSYANFIMQKSPNHQLRDTDTMLFDNPSAPASFWSALPMEDLATGTGQLFARSDWSNNPVFGSFFMGNFLQADHQQFTPGQFQIQRGPDDLLINANAPGGNQGFSNSTYGNTIVVDDNGDGAQTFRFQMGVWYGAPGIVVNSYESDQAGTYSSLAPDGTVVDGGTGNPNANYVYMSGDFKAAYSRPDDPGGGGSVSALTRQVVYLRPNLFLVYDHVTTIKDTYTKELQWNFLNPPTVSGNSFVETVGNSNLYGQMYSQVPIATTVSTVNIANVDIQEMDTENTNPTATVNYVTTFQATALATTKPTFNQHIVSADQQLEGAQLGNNVVLFGVNGTADMTAPISYLFSGSATTGIKHLVTSLPAGQKLNVMLNGQLLTTATVSAQGTISFATTGKGKETITLVPASPFVVTAISNSSAGQTFTFKVAAEDGNGHILTGYRGTVSFATSSVKAHLPGNYKFTATDNGVHTFTVTLNTPGEQTVTVTDVNNSSVTATVSVLVRPGPAVKLIVAGFPTTTTAGVSHDFTVTAVDAFGNIATGYEGEVRFSSKDPHADLPDAFAFDISNNGVRTFSATLKTAGSRSISVADVDNTAISGTEGAITVLPAAASRLRIVAPASATAGAAFSITVTALDAFGNVATSYTGTIHFKSSDPNAQLPADYAFTAADAGKHTFTNQVVLATVGKQTVTATDILSTGLSSSASIVVSASGPTTDDLYWRADFERGLENAKWWEEHIGRPLGYGEFGFSFPGS
jgi:hypothetical protein